MDSRNHPFGDASIQSLSAVTSTLEYKIKSGTFEQQRTVRAEALGIDSVVEHVHLNFLAFFYKKATGKHFCVIKLFSLDYQK